MRALNAVESAPQTGDGFKDPCIGELEDPAEVFIWRGVYFNFCAVSY